MNFYLITGLVIIFLYLLYYFYFGPSKLERDIKKMADFIIVSIAKKKST